MSNEAPIQINWKTKKDGMLINLRANDVFQLDELLDGITQRLATLIDLEKTTESMVVPSPMQTIANAFPGATVVSQTPAPRPAQAAPAGAPDCACGGGPMRFVAAGISKSTGKPYRAFYACPKPQGQACNHKAQP